MKAVQSAIALEAEAVSKSYASKAGRYAVLQDVSLTVRAGEFVSLLGPSGGGKSTLLNIMAGLEAPDNGAVRVQGVAPGARPPVAYMQQKDLLLPWRTLWDNIMLGPELRSREEKARLSTRARALLVLFDLQGFAQSYPAQLSGGMRQRAALLRTLLCEQDILLLDEPFGALDALTRKRLHGYLYRVWREFGKTVLLVTHDVEEAVSLSTRVALLSARPGRVVREFEVSVPFQARSQSPEALRLKRRILQTLEADAR